MKAELKLVLLNTDVVTTSGADCPIDGCICYDPEDIGEICKTDE